MNIQEGQTQTHESIVRESEIVWKKPQRNILKIVWSKIKSSPIKEENPIGTKYEGKFPLSFIRGSNNFLKTCVFLLFRQRKWTYHDC